MEREHTTEEINGMLEASWKAFHEYRLFPLSKRAEFMRAIAVALESSGDELLRTASEETNLPEARVRTERGRTIHQLNSYAAACEQGSWLEARIDTADPARTPPKPDIRKMMVPLGPVVVFGASNFPFAYSTAGGDTACAFAAGCPVIVKAHPAHARTSDIVADAIWSAANSTGMPAGIFHHVHGGSFETGKTLVMHPKTRAVGFTGSTSGGKALFDWANQRPDPIPVFAEMGSVNPIFLLPEKLAESPGELATSCAASVNLGAGQFCTNPGLIFGIKGSTLEDFKHHLSEEMKKASATRMLHPGIAKSFRENRMKAISQEEIRVLVTVEALGDPDTSIPTIAITQARDFLSNPVLHEEVFGPYSLIVECEDAAQMLEIAENLEGQLTATMMATENDLHEHQQLAEALKNICGRLIVNNVPTGVEVVLSMHHGGPYPATTDSRFSSVGADGIRRFARPLSFQNWPQALLPEALQDSNPLMLWRTVNNAFTKDAISSR